jgi:hypothetical protein
MSLKKITLSPVKNIGVKNIGVKSSLLIYSVGIFLLTIYLYEVFFITLARWLTDESVKPNFSPIC